MLTLPDLSAILKGVNSDHLEDLGDRLNFYVTIYLVLFFTIVTGSRQHFGQPISCMAPAEIHGVDAWSRYFHDYCYVGTKYRVKDTEKLANSQLGSAGVGHAGMEYYQWVPYLLLVQVLFFYLPKVIWQAASYNFGNGLDMEAFVRSSVNHHVEYGDNRRRSVKTMANFLSDSNKFRRILGSWRDSLMYVVMKWTCVLNSLAQIYFMSWFVADWNLSWAFQMVQHLYYEKTSESVYFPRVAFCDIRKLEMGQTLGYTLQCVLMFNFVNEKIFLFLFFWVMMLFFINFVTAVRQTLQLLCAPYRYWSAQMILPPSTVLFHDLPCSPLQSTNLLKYFIHESLGCDGIFLLESVSSHSGRIMAREIAAELFYILVSKKHEVLSPPETLPRPKIMDLNEEDSNDLERQSFVPSTLDKRHSRSSPTISVPPYHSLFTLSGREK